jgi:hypothetical protein
MKKLLLLTLLCLLAACSEEWTAVPATAYWEVVLQYESTMKKTATTIAWNDTAGNASELIPGNTTGERMVWQKRITCKEFDTLNVTASLASSPSLDSGFVLSIYLPCESGHWITLGQFKVLNGPVSYADLVRVLPPAATYYRY